MVDEGSMSRRRKNFKLRGLGKPGNKILGLNE